MNNSNPTSPTTEDCFPYVVWLAAERRHTSMKDHRFMWAFKHGLAKHVSGEISGMFRVDLTPEGNAAWEAMKAKP